MLKQFILWASYFLFLLTTVSCVSGQQHKNQAFENSLVYPSVKCVADTSVSYALVLPPQYTKEKPCQVLFLFDPHGDGLLPVNLFNAEAAKNGCILAGSNNSKNGLPIEQTTAIYRKMLADISARFNIEKKSVYVCGFSGGSRVAGAVAITEGSVAGVVGCGAGLPNINQNPVQPFSYLAVVGNQDFNYAEMQQLDESLEAAGYQHHLLVFDGIHQWPPKEQLPDIFTWLRFDAMRQKSIPADKTEINSFIEKNYKIGADFASRGQLHVQQETYIKMMHYLQGLTDVTPLQSEITRLSAEQEVIAYNKQQKQLFELERQLQQKYAPQFQTHSLEYWTKEASQLQALAKKPGEPGTNQVYQRVLGFLSINSYSYSNSALKQGDLVAAAKFIEIYRLVDPTNAEHRYMAAKVAALNHKPDECFLALNQAFDLGFKDINRLKSDADFKPYLHDSRFIQLVNRK
jgi:pimeloyl-ACP methyl ester carboxylesterase